MMNLGLKIETVRLVPHDESWKEIFLVEKTELEKVLGEKILGIEHVGSTAITGIKAKPVLDLMVGVKTLGKPEEYTSDLQKLGYIFHKDSRVDQQHILFVKGAEESRTHYLKVTAFGSDFWEEHVVFRDFLIQHPEYARQYEELKLKLLEEHKGTRIPYTKGKDSFIRNILKLAGYKGKIV